jgi:hypothetical protein
MPKSKSPLTLLHEWLDTGDPPRPRDLPEAEAIAAAAREQGVAGLLQDVVGCSADWPAEAREALARSRRASLVTGVRRLDVAARVLNLLERKGLRALPLKGAALAETLYDSVADRPMADTDLLVLDDAAGARALLREHGFRELGAADHAVSFADPHSSGVVEVHHDLTSCPGLFPLDREGLWARSRPAPGQVSRVPSPEDLLVQLALHAAFQHGLVLSLVQHLDFRRLFARVAIDARAVAAIAAASRAEASVAAALRAAEAIVGARVPGALAEHFRSRLPPPLARWLDDRLSDPLSLVVPATPALARVRWGLVPGRRLELLRHSVFVTRPGPAEQVLRRALSPLARLLHLLRRWGLPAWRSWSCAPRERGPAPAAVHLAGAEPSEPESPAAEAIVAECLRSFPHVRLTVTGGCMGPALRPGDTVLVADPSLRPPRFGDVVLFRHPEGLRLHRLVWAPPLAGAGSAWRTKGDRAPRWDPRICSGDVLGTVIAVEGREHGHGVPTALRSLAQALLASARDRLAAPARA